eukprot:363421-Chlamydomonas_euryale.AAC.6
MPAVPDHERHLVVHHAEELVGDVGVWPLAHDDVRVLHAPQAAAVDADRRVGHHLLRGKRVVHAVDHVALVQPQHVAAAVMRRQAARPVRCAHA